MSQDTSSRAHLVERAAEMLSRQAHEPQPHAEQPRSSMTALLTLPSPQLIPLAALRAAGLVASIEGGRPSRTQEEIALVQHQLLRNADEFNQRRIILVASALPREGRSFMAMNIAASIATAGARPVLLVDADGRMTGLTHTLSLEGRAGLRELIAEPHRRGNELTLPTALERLSVLPYGMGRAGEAAPGGTLADAIRRLAAALPHHVILLDTPPCLSASDASALASAAGQVMLVVDAQRTSRAEVEAALDLLEACPVLQLMLNRVRLQGRDSFGARAEDGAAHGV